LSVTAFKSPLRSGKWRHTAMAVMPYRLAPINALVVTGVVNSRIVAHSAAFSTNRPFDAYL
jgi:hypothetical protein